MAVSSTISQINGQGSKAHPVRETEDKAQKYSVALHSGGMPRDQLDVSFAVDAIAALMWQTLAWCS